MNSSMERRRLFKVFAQIRSSVLLVTNPCPNRTTPTRLSLSSIRIRFKSNPLPLAAQSSWSGQSWGRGRKAVNRLLLHLAVDGSAVRCGGGSMAASRPPRPSPRPRTSRRQRSAARQYFNEIHRPFSKYGSRSSSTPLRYEGNRMDEEGEPCHAVYWLDVYICLIGWPCRHRRCSGPGSASRSDWNGKYWPISREI